MATATYVLDIDWDGDGVWDGGDEDVTSDLIRVQFVTGRKSADVLAGEAQAGRLVATLRNDDDKYNAFNGSSALFGDLLPGRLVRLRTTAPSSKTLWQGVLDKIEPTVRWPGRKRVKITALGPISTLADTKVNISMQSSSTTDVLIEEILDAVDWPSADRDMDTGAVTVTRFWTSDKRLALNLIRELEASENGFLRESHDGDIVFEKDGARQTDTRANTVQATFNDAPTGSELPFEHIAQAEPLAQVRNDIRTSVRNFSVQSLAVLWTHPEATTSAGSPSLAPAETLTFWARFPNPSSATEAVAVDAWTTPVSTTDYTANTADDGTGTDRTADLGIVVTKFAEAMKIEVTNNHGSDTVYLTLFQARGTAVHVSDPVEVQAEDATSQGDYDVRTFDRGQRAAWVPDTATAQAWADNQLLLFKDPQPVVTLRYLANLSSDLLDEAIEREVSDRINVGAANSAGLGFAQDFFVERIAHDIRLGINHRVEYLLSSTAAFDTFWVLGTTSTLGTSTRANFG